MYDEQTGWKCLQSGNQPDAQALLQQRAHSFREGGGASVGQRHVKSLPGREVPFLSENPGGQRGWSEVSKRAAMGRAEFGRTGQINILVHP